MISNGDIKSGDLPPHFRSVSTVVTFAFSSEVDIILCDLAKKRRTDGFNSRKREV
jgi:hypothetical protein